MKRIVVVCQGNTCRSAMGEGLLREMLGGRVAADVVSAGLDAPPGRLAARHAVAVMGEIGVDISGHRTRPLEPALIREAHTIVAVEPDVRDAIVRRYPEASAKIRTLDVPDPYCGDVHAYRERREQLRAQLPALVEELTTDPVKG